MFQVLNADMYDVIILEPDCNEKYVGWCSYMINDYFVLIF